MPKVSVLMSVYNGARYLPEAVESVLDQTFTDFEFIIVDDGSIGETPIILDAYNDPRLVRLRNQTNIGLVASLNRGLAAARGEYIARQDADDISLPQRLAKQVELLDAHPQVGLVGSWYAVIDAGGREEQVIQCPTENTEIQEHLFYSNCFCHGAVIFRREALTRVGCYREEFDLAEDWDLWLRIAERYELANIPEPLYHWRLVPGSVSQANRHGQRRAARRVIEEAVQRRLSSVGVARPSDKALAKYHLHLAYEDLSEGEDGVARENLERVFSLDPGLAQDADFVLDSLAYWAFDVCRVAPVTSPARRAGLGREYILRFFNSLPPSADGLASQRRKALGRFHVITAFASYRTGVFADVRRHCLAGLFHDPGWLRNRGVLSILIRSLLRV